MISRLRREVSSQLYKRFIYFCSWQPLSRDGVRTPLRRLENEVMRPSTQSSKSKLLLSSDVNLMKVNEEIIFGNVLVGFFLYRVTPSLFILINREILLSLTQSVF